MRAVFVPVLLLCSLCTHAQSPAEQRFEGSASLRPAPPSSGGGRFSLSAELHSAALAPTTGRFRIDAGLKPGRDAKTLATACGAATIDIFRNGFEN